MGPGLDDPIWPYILTQRLSPYIPKVREWWTNVESYTVNDTGIYELYDENAPGLMVRFTRTAKRSPVKGIQAFPFVCTGYLQLSGVQGGANKMIERVCMKGLTIDEFTIVEKHNLPSTFQQGQFVAFIPTDLLKDTTKLGIWLYLTPSEMKALASNVVVDTVKQKVLLKI